jgi:hypothetical protein
MPMTESMAEVAECLPSKCKALGRGGPKIGPLHLAKISARFIY